MGWLTMLEEFITTHGEEYLITAISGAGAVILVLTVIYVGSWLWSKSKVALISLVLMGIVYSDPSMPMKLVRLIDRAIGPVEEEPNASFPGNAQEFTGAVLNCYWSHFEDIYKSGNLDELPQLIRGFTLEQQRFGFETVKPSIIKDTQTFWKNVPLSDFNEEKKTAASDGALGSDMDKYLAGLFFNCAHDYASGQWIKSPVQLSY
jgi:hypothetical protein